MAPRRRVRLVRVFAVAVGTVLGVTVAVAVVAGRVSGAGSSSLARDETGAVKAGIERVREELSFASRAWSSSASASASSARAAAAFRRHAIERHKGAPYTCTAL